MGLFLAVCGPFCPAQQLAQVKESQMYFPANHVYTHICHGDFMGRGQKSCIQFSLTWDIRKHVWSLWVLLPLLGNYSLRVFFFFKKLFWKKLFFFCFKLIYFYVLILFWCEKIYHFDIFFKWKIFWKTTLSQHQTSSKTSFDIVRDSTAHIKFFSL
jgi:hypothetical protein